MTAVAFSTLQSRTSGVTINEQISMISTFKAFIGYFIVRCLSQTSIAGTQKRLAKELSLGPHKGDNSILMSVASAL